MLADCAVASFFTVVFFGTQSVVFAKCMGELFSLWIVWLDSGKEEGSNSFTHWFTYFVIAAWLATAGIWLFRLNEALGKYNPLFIIPLLQSNFIFFAIVSGGIYFREFDAYEPLNWLGFWAGVLIMFYGLFLLSPDDMHDDDDARASPPDALGDRLVRAAVVVAVLLLERGR